MASGTRAPSTIVTVNLSGQTDFNIPFEYLARKFVVVTLLGVDRQVLTLNSDYRFVSKTVVSLANPTPAGYNQLELRRETSATERLVDFHDGSILRAYDLNLSQIQTLHVAEEARDLTADTIGVNDEGHLDARNRKIVNLAYAENGGDAIPLGQVYQWNDSAYHSMVRAEAAQAVTEASTAVAVKAKDDARESEVNAQTSASGSAASAQTAVDARNDTLSAQTDVTTKHDTVVVKHDEVMQVVPKLDDAVQMMTGLGNVPVGVVAMTMTPHVPAGWVRCGEAFDKATYPALAKLYPSGVVPSFDERFAKGVSRGDADKLGTHGVQSLPVHSHNIPRVVVEGQTTAHDYGAVAAETPARVVGYLDTSLVPGGGPYAIQDGGVTWGHADNYREFSLPAQGFNVYVGAHSHSLSGASTVPSSTEATGDGGTLEPAHTNVWFIIKAAEGIADKDDAMQVVGTIVGRVDAAETEITQLKAKVATLEANAAKTPSFCAMSHIDAPDLISPAAGSVWQLGSGGRVYTVGVEDNDDFNMQAADQPRVYFKQAGLYEIQYNQLSGQDSVARDRRLALGYYNGDTLVGTIAMGGGVSTTTPADCFAVVFPAKAGDQVRLSSGSNAYYGATGHNRLMCRRVG